MLSIASGSVDYTLQWAALCQVFKSSIGMYGQPQHVLVPDAVVQLMSELKCVLSFFPLALFLTRKELTMSLANDLVYVGGSNGTQGHGVPYMGSTKEVS